MIDPHGLRLALVESARRPRLGSRPGTAAPCRRSARSAGSTAPSSGSGAPPPTAEFLTGVLGFQRLASEDGWTRYGFADAAGVVDVRETPEARRGAWGVGSVHHLAWRGRRRRASSSRVRAQVEAAGAAPTPVIDRFWFKSVYFQEPGGVLFELATDGPGFAVDEDPAHLGETLVLPPWLEPSRGEIEAMLPPLRPPA